MTHQVQIQKYKGCMRCIILFLCLLLWVTAVRAQTVEQVTINYIEAAPSPDQWGNRVRAYVTVSSADQEAVRGLSSSNFKTLEDGNGIEIQDVSQTSDPMSIVLAIDTSGSMQARDKSGKTSMEAAKEAAVEFICMLGDEDRIALYSFDNETNFHSDFTTDHESSIEAVHRLSAKHMAATRLYDTALEAVKKASEIPRGRRAVILLTDGKDERGDGTCSIHSSNDVINAATTRTIRVPIYTMGVGPQVDARELARMASLTGGRSMLASSLSELPGFYRTIANQLKNQYAVEFISRSPSGEHSLVIKVKQGEGMEQDERRFWSPPLPVMQPPSVDIVSPDPSAPIKDMVKIRAEVTPEKGVAKIRYYVDGTLKEEDTDPPLGEFLWDTAGLARGLHVLRVEAVHKNGRIGSGEMTLEVAAPLPAEPPVETPAIPQAEMQAEPPEQSSGLPEEKGGISPLAWISILFLLIIIAAICCLRLRQGRKKPPAPAREAGAGTAARPIRREKAATPKPAVSEQEANEATAMDVRSTLDPLAKLTVLKSQKMDLGATFKVLGNTEIGRSAENSVRLPDKPVSRKHAVIYYSGGNFFIRDLKSTYGTTVDGRKVTSAGVVLKDGAQIQLGPATILEFNVLVFGTEEQEDKDRTKIYGQE